MKVIGHKGAGNQAPENTRASLERALAIGVDAIEVDVWPTADERFVLFHDSHVERLTGHSGWTSYLTSDELLSLEVGSSFSPEYTGERVLLLEEALEMLSGKVDLVLELKRTRHELARYSWVEKRLWEILEAFQAQSWTLVVSFDHQSLFDLRKVASEVRIGMLYAGQWLSLREEVEYLAPEVLLSHWAQTTPTLVEMAHGAQRGIYPWVVNHESWMREFVKMDVDGIITDCPDVLLRILGQQEAFNESE